MFEIFNRPLFITLSKKYYFDNIESVLNDTFSKKKVVKWKNLCFSIKKTVKTKKSKFIYIIHKSNEIQIIIGLNRDQREVYRMFKHFQCR